jgi:hypothetical protein
MAPSMQPTTTVACGSPLAVIVHTVIVFTVLMNSATSLAFQLDVAIDDGAPLADRT